MSAIWFGGLQVRRLERGQTPVADLHCTACGLHVRVTGRLHVADFLRAQPMNEHRATCPARAASTERTAA
ncbi:MULTISPECIES: hypothetical protein [Streptomyces]|uniref:Transcription factor WhiB n=1 Tax=Streptomyces evansiae TaxID=3075535 RepID=A0ABU2R2H4_9ACTN|nr:MULTISPECIES: hypothetical protein [unclassified Streptomyces]MDT0409910.1 transcription factor WhiB [Streptomyces sp. DSM 41979]MYQ60002.1 transcription factor WhiB [Streptomyces sp. SID4926]SCE40245.1 hypothetical protein GA0115252_146420 [Streptomyces sp. DfronAA-171]